MNQVAVVEELREGVRRVFDGEEVEDLPEQLLERIDDDLATPAR